MAVNTRPTKVTYQLNSDQREFLIPYEYLSRKFIRVTLMGLEKETLLTLNVDYRFVAPGRLRLNKAWGPNDGYTLVELARYTSATERLVDFNDGSILRAYDLNISQVQAIHIAEEGRNIADLALVMKGLMWDARNMRIINLGDPLLPADAANVRWTESRLSELIRTISGSANVAGSVVFAGFDGVTRTVQHLGTEVGADMLGYKHKQSRSVARSIASKLDENISVNDFGADPSGVRDSTEAFLAAGRGYVPAGRYKVDTRRVYIGDFWGHGDIASHTGHIISLINFYDSNRPVQAQLMNLQFGFNNGNTNTELYFAARNALQGLSIIEVDGVEMAFITQRIRGASWSTSERVRIIAAPLKDTGEVFTPKVWSKEINLGHGIDLTAKIENGQVYLYTSSSVLDESVTGTRGGKGYSRVLWRGAATDQSNVETFMVVGQEESEHPYKLFNRCTVAISDDDRYLVMASAPINKGYVRTVLVYDWQKLQLMGDKTQARPVYFWDTQIVAGQSNNVLQGICSDGRTVSIVFGGTDTFGTNQIVDYDISGKILGQETFDGSLAIHGIDGLLNNPSYGFPWRHEPEGICNWNGGRVVSVAEGWLRTAKVRSYLGANWAYISRTSGSGVPPSNGSRWVRTTKPAAKEYDPKEVLQNTENFSRDKKYLYYVGASLGLPQETSTSAGIRDVLDPSALKSGQGGGATSLGFQARNDFTARGYFERYGTYINGFTYDSSSRWRIYDQRDGYNNDKFASIQAFFDDESEHSMILRGSGTNSSEGPSIKLVAKSSKNNSNTIRMYTGDLGSTRFVLDENGQARFNSSGNYIPMTLQRPNSGRNLTITRDNVDIGGLAQNTAGLVLQSAEGLNLRFGTVAAGQDKNMWELSGATGAWRPFADNIYAIGQASLRCSEIYAGTGTINTSDARHKSPVSSLSAAEVRVGLRLAKEIGTYRWLDAVSEKHGGSRLHAGMTVQRAIEVFREEGLDPLAYGMICHDEWEEKTEVVPAVVRGTGILGEDGEELTIVETPEYTRVVREAGDLYGFRDNELHHLMIAALATKLTE